MLIYRLTPDAQTDLIEIRRFTIKYHPHSGGYEVAPPRGAISGEGPTGAA